MINILDGLNKEQREAVLQKQGTMLVLAGAGCGKTKVLTTRIAELVSSGVSPYEILAVTFTNKAAKEMVERLSKIIGEERAKKAWVGTFHNIAGRILRMDIDKYTDENGRKIDKSFVIYDETDSLAIIKNAIKANNLDEKVYQPKLIKTVISNAKNKGQNAYAYATKARDYRSEKISQVYLEYQKQLQINNALDFDDMLLLAVKLLETSDEVRTKYHNRFKHVLVDEFQDTNITQYQMINHIYTNNLSENELTNRSLCVVGDVDQSIYSWRGADYKIILNFQNNFKNTKLVKLEQNYRSVETILTAANSIITNNSQRLDKKLYSNLGKGELIELFEANDESDEANYLLRNIKSLTKENSLANMAVLYRTNSQSRAVEEACIANGVPYKIVGGLKFYDRKEIKDIVAYLKLAYNPNDSQALRRIINVPKRSIGATTLQKVQEIALSQDASMFSIIANIEEYDEFSAGTKTKLTNFVNLMNKIQRNSNSLNLYEYIAYILEESGYLAELKEEDSVEAETRIENLQEFINVAKDFEPSKDGDVLGEFLSQVSLVSDIDSYDNSAESLTLMTLHSAKGLEYDVIFLSGLEEGIFPHSRSINSNSEMEEERRLMYVGVTRAKKKLFISHAKRRQMWGEYRYYNPSRFLTEIPSNIINSNTSTSSASSSTFKSAVNKIQSVKQDYNGKVMPTNSFGKSFVAPQKRAIVVKSEKNIPNHKTQQSSNEEKIKQILENNPIKKMLEEKWLKETASAESNTLATNVFKSGDRVFHSKFGIGNITEIKEIAGSKMFIIDFGKQGQKAMDASFADLKKF